MKKKDTIKIFKNMMELFKATLNAKKICLKTKQ